MHAESAIKKRLATAPAYGEHVVSRNVQRAIEEMEEALALTPDEIASQRQGA